MIAARDARHRRSITCRSGGKGHVSVLLALLVSLPFLNDVIRKYVWYSDLVFVAVAAAVTSGAIWSLGRVIGLHRRMAVLYVLGLLYLAAGVVATLFHPEATIGAYLVGLYALVVPFFYFVTAHYLGNRTRDPVWRAAKVVTFWSTVILAVAVAQLILGPRHEINRLAGELGFGVYAYSGGESVPGVFRPASIFLHTGKLGQVALTLALFKLAILVERSTMPRWFLPSVLIDIAVLVASGQRMAWILFLLVIVGILTTQPIRRKVRVASLAVLVLGSVAIGWQAGGGEFFSAVGGRVAHALDTAGDRLYLNVLRPWGPVLETVGFLGSGFGMFTTGSSAFGGRRLYLAVTDGIPEGTWYRVLGETGLPGVTLFLFMFVAFVVVGYVSYRNADLRRAPAALFLLWWLGAMALWGIFHDVFANSTAVALAFALGGLGTSRRPRR